MLQNGFASRAMYYTLKDENVKKCIRMGINKSKSVTFGEVNRRLCGCKTKYANIKQTIGFFVIHLHPPPLITILVKHNYAGTFDVSCGMFSNVSISNVIGLVLRYSDIGSENISFIRLSVSDGQKTCSSKCVSLIGI